MSYLKATLQKEGIKNLRNRLKISAKIVEPPPDLTISQWADKYRQLSGEATAETGSWRTDRAPFQRGMMDVFNDPEIDEIYIMTCTQIGKTEMINNVIAYHIDLDPCPSITANFKHGRHMVQR